MIDKQTRGLLIAFANASQPAFDVGRGFVEVVRGHK
jgi:hypothetical protein